MSTTNGKPTASDKLSSLRNALTDTTLLCRGTAHLNAQSRLLFYRHASGTEANWLDLSDAADVQLQRLVSACEMGGDQVWTLDRTRFSPSFDVHDTDILNHIRTNLLSTGDAQKRVKVELQKLDVYGPESRFKHTKDTILSENTFGTLIVVFPTPHQGGSLQLRRGAKEWTFDSSAAIATSRTPSVAYIAFLNDVEHEISPVQSGYRVSLTYNLYFDPESPPPSQDSPGPEETAFHAALKALLDDSTFLPHGGLMGFGLRHRYSIKPGSTKLHKLLDSLQGSDALIKRACTQFSLQTSLKAIYSTQRQYSSYKYNVMMGKAKSFEGACLENGLKDALIRQGGKVTREFGAPELVERYKWMEKGDQGRKVDSVEVLWVTPLQTGVAGFKTTYLASGGGGEGEGALGYACADVCLVVKVGPAGERTTVRPAAERAKVGTEGAKVEG